MMRKQEGLTIVEIVVTIALFGLGVAMIATLATNVQKTQQGNVQLGKAANIASGKLERLKLLTIADMPSHRAVDFRSEIESNLRATRASYTIDPVGARTDIWRAVVTVELETNGTRRSAEYVTLLYPDE